MRMKLTKPVYYVRLTQISVKGQGPSQAEVNSPLTSHHSRSHSHATLVDFLQLPLAFIVEYALEIHAGDQGTMEIFELRGQRRRKETQSREFHIQKFGSIANKFDLHEFTVFSLWIASQYKYKEKLRLICRWKHT